MIYFITQKYIIDNTPITSNTDPKLLFPHIEAAQKLYLMSILGSEFYTDILAKFEAQTLNADETTLVQTFIKPYVLWRTLVFAFPFIEYQIRNKGFMQDTDENSQNISLGTLQYMINEASNRAEFYGEELQKYLCKYNNLFPLYKSQNGLTSPNNSSEWDFGIIMH